MLLYRWTRELPSLSSYLFRLGTPAPHYLHRLFQHKEQVITKAYFSSYLDLNEIHDVEYVGTMLSSLSFKSQTDIRKMKPLQSVSRRFSTLSLSDNDVDCSNLDVESYALSSRINRLSRLLDCSEKDARNHVEKYTFLKKMDLDLVESKIKVITSYGLPLSIVQKNLRILQHTSISKIAKRLQVLLDVDILHSQFIEIYELGHFLECGNTDFSIALRGKIAERDALEGCPDRKSYLQMRLGCSESIAETLLKSCHLKRHASNRKLKLYFDFLMFEAERSPEFVIKNIKLLGYSVSRLRERWVVIKKAKIKSEKQMVFIWCMSKKDFDSTLSLSDNDEDFSKLIISANTLTVSRQFSTLPLPDHNEDLSKLDVESSRIHQLSHLLDCSEKDARSHVEKYTFLEKMDLDLVESKIKVITSFGLPLSIVQNNIQILKQMSTSEIAKRLQVLLDADILHSQFIEINELGYFLECGNTDFSIALSGKIGERDALEGCPDRKSYLQMRLCCAESIAETLLKSYPIKKYSNRKIKLTFAFLMFEAERSPEFVMKNIKLLKYSVSRLRERWEVIKKAEIKSENQMVSIWCMSKEDFDTKYEIYLNDFVKNKDQSGTC